MKPFRLAALLLVLLSLTLAACGGDDAKTGGGDTTTVDSTPTATDAPPAEAPTEKPPWDPEGFTFSGDDLLKCLDDDGYQGQREDKPAADDKVGAGIAHDRVLVSGAGDPALRVFMFGSPDLAREQGKLVAARSDGTRVLGSVILEPLTDDVGEESDAAIDCLKKQT